MGYSEGANKYPDKWATGICMALVDEGEFDDQEDCEDEASGPASDQASNWEENAPEKMAAYIR